MFSGFLDPQTPYANLNTLCYPTDLRALVTLGHIFYLRVFARYTVVHARNQMSPHRRCSSSRQTATIWPCHFRITILQYSYCPKEFYCCVLGAETLCKGTSSLSHLINVPIRKNWRRILHSSPNNSNLSWETSLAPYVDPPGRSKFIFHANSTPWLLSQVLVLSLGGQGECYRAPLPLIGLPSITFWINLPEFYLNYWNLIGYDTRSIFCDRQLVANSVRM